MGIFDDISQQIHYTKEGDTESMSTTLEYDELVMRDALIDSLDPGTIYTIVVYTISNNLNKSEQTRVNTSRSLYYRYLSIAVPLDVDPMLQGDTGLLSIAQC